jgi:hypothetical protein
MSTTVMQENSRSTAKAADVGDPEQGRERDPEQSRANAPPIPPPPPAAKKPSHNPPPSRFVGHAMRALFESSEVSIRRGDETRVMSRAQEAMAEIQRKSSGPPPPPRGAPPVSSSTRPGAGAPRSGDPSAPISSRPPAPRVDAVLWIVLAVGLFAIAGWMIAYAL